MIRQRGIVPECAVLPGRKTVKHRQPVGLQVGKDGAGVVELVGARHEEDVRAGLLQMGDIGFLARLPGRLWRTVRIGAAADDGRDPGTEPCGNDAFLFNPTVFDRVVQHSGYCLVFVAAMLKNQAGHAKEVADVRRFRAFPRLCSVDAERKRNGLRQT